MSINVTGNGNRLNIRRGRMVLSDLDQIKRNERDRRRRLRLEQVRQQSKDISDRLLERTKNVLKGELNKIENSDKLSSKQTYNGKIMEVQQKYQEDVADIGLAHIAATFELDHDALIEEKDKQNKLVALKRGKDAMQQVQNIQQKETVQQQYQERLRQVREVENMRSAMIANLPKKVIPEADTVCISVQNDPDQENKQQKTQRKKTKKILTKKSPRKVTRTYIKIVGNASKTLSPVLRSKTITVEKNLENELPLSKEQSIISTVAESSHKEGISTAEFGFKENKSQKEVGNIPIRIVKTTGYNPEDYAQASSNTNNDSLSSFSDDSSYFSDSGEQCVSKDVETTRYVKCPVFDKVQLYDHAHHQSNVYDQPIGIVEKIQTWNEPSAMDLAQKIERVKTADTQLSECRRQNTQKRGEDAALREKVRRDYRNLLQNLNQLASEERKLKASQVDHYRRDAYLREEQRKLLRDQHKNKLNRAMKTLLNQECNPQCEVERQITLTPRQPDGDMDICVNWESPLSFKEHVGTSTSLQREPKESSISREEQILDMLKKVERQKKLLLQEFGASLPNDIFNASVRSLFDRDKSVQTQTTTSEDINIVRNLSPEIKVISASPEEKNKRDASSVKTVETAVQATIKNKSIQEDKSTQVEREYERKSEDDSMNKEPDAIPHPYPLEPQITVVRPQVDSSDSSSSETIQAVTDNDLQNQKITPKKKRYTMKTKKNTDKKISKSCSTISNKTISPAKKLSRSLQKSQHTSPKQFSGAEDMPTKKIKMYVDKNGVNIKVKPSQVAEVAVDVSTQSTQVYTSDQGQSTTKSQWVQTKARRIQIKDVSDTSTSFASPPPTQPRDLLEALNNNMSILEMLDSSANESMKRLKRDISPVSTPETPSPRTMRMPSNIPHPERLKKLLKYVSVDSQLTDNNVQSFSKNDYSTSTDFSEYTQNEHLSSESVSVQPEPSMPMQFCLCNNPECRQVHSKFDELRNYAMKNCPHILQKYEELQTTCAERIISLTNLIEKVRSEQKGMETSMISPYDETSLMQLPPPQMMRNDLQSVQKLVENIEAIHNQLAKTLIESQKIIQDKVGGEECVEEVKNAVNLINAGTSIKAVYATKIDKSKIKPRIVNEEKVNIQLNRYKTQNSPKILTASTPKQDVSPASKSHEEMMIDKLSKEILEQSEGVNNNLISPKEVNTSVTRNSVETSTVNYDLRTNTIPKIPTTRTGTNKQMNKEPEQTKDFIPLLNDIPRLLKTVDSVMQANNGRSKPPVSLLSGPYRSEIESSGHELSTIIEFDTPDTPSKNQNNRSTSSIKKAMSHQITTSVLKPVENISSSLGVHNLHVDRLCNSSITKLSSAISAQKTQERSAFFDLLKTSKNIANQKVIANKDIQETGNKKLQCDTEVQHFCTDINNDGKKDKEKITSTSSNSFSELSGVSQIASTPSSTILKYASSPEEMETALKKLGLGWAVTTLKKTREASALSSSSNSDGTLINTAKRMLSPIKKQFDSNYGLPDFSDVSSISIKEASKSTEQAVLLKGRTSTPKLLNSNTNSGTTNTSNTNNSENFPEPDDGLTIPVVSLAMSKSNFKKLEN